LIETPKRLVDAYKEFFDGYKMNPDEILSKTFEEVEGYDEMVIIKNIRLESHCEHHIVPILGIAHVAYMPNKKVVGISKLARLVDVYAKRHSNTIVFETVVVTLMKMIMVFIQFVQK
jgi:GTP cyclohydrolase I